MRGAKTSLGGVFPVLPTPFDATGAVDDAAFRGLASFAIESGANGVVFPGMASEVETLLPDERGRLVALLGPLLAGKAAFIVGASDPQPERAAERAREGAAVGAAAAMVMAPHALGRDREKQIAYFTQVAEASGLPIMLQNAPPPNGAGLDPEEVAAIAAAVPGVRFVKEETLPCGQNVTRILAIAAGRLDGVFGGAGARFLPDELARGAAGTMPALEIADLHVAMWRGWKAGDAARARALYNDTLPLLVFQMVFRVRATKEVLHRRGLLAHTGARAAGPTLDPGDLVELGELLNGCSRHLTRHPLRKGANAAA